MLDSGLIIQVPLPRSIWMVTRQTRTLANLDCPMYDRSVSSRSAIVFFLACLLAASSSLACLANSSMTPAEMECCKKMAGNCDMGGGNHKCCSTAVNHGNSAAVTAPGFFHHDSDVIVVQTVYRPEVGPRLTGKFSLEAISPSPPGSTIVLRI